MHSIFQFIKSVLIWATQLKNNSCTEGSRIQQIQFIGFLPLQANQSFAFQVYAAATVSRLPNFMITS